MSDSDTSSTMTPLIGRGENNSRIITRRRKRDRIFGRCERQLRTFTPRHFFCYSMLSLIFFTLAITLPIFVDKFVKEGIRDAVIIDSRNAAGFEQFRNKSSEGENLLKFYFFNITNPNAVLNGEKPFLEEVGPFVYRTFQIRSDFHWNFTQDTLSFRTHKFYVFDKDATFELSHGQFDSDDVEVTTINMLFLGMEAQVGEDFWYIISEVLWGSDFERLFTKQSVKKLISGYSVEVSLEGLQFEIPIRFPGLYPNVTKEQDDTFKIPTEMRVGALEIEKAHEIVKWKGSNHLKILCPWGVNPLPLGTWCPGDFPCCRSKQKDTSQPVPIWGEKIEKGVWDADANKVKGTTGEQFWPGVKREDTLYIFNEVLQRPLRFRNDGSPNYEYRGISMVPFSPTFEIFENASTRAANARYYNFGPAGIFNISIVEEGADLYFSLPHFLYGEPRLLEDVEGLHPDEQLHKMVIYVEPLTGQTMVEHARAQVNARLPKKHKWSWTQPWFEKLRENTFVPIAWFEDESYVDDKGVSDFQTLSTAIELRIILIMLNSLFGGVFALMVGGAYLAKRRKTSGEEQGS